MPPCLIWQVWKSAKRGVEVYVMYIIFIEHLLCARHCSICMCLSFFRERGVIQVNIMELRRSRKLNKDTPEMGILTCPSQTPQQADLCFSQASLTSGSENLFNVRNAMGVCDRSGYCRTTAETGAGRLLLVIRVLDLMGAAGEKPSGNCALPGTEVSACRVSLLGVSSPRAPLLLHVLFPCSQRPCPAPPMPLLPRAHMLDVRGHLDTFQSVSSCGLRPQLFFAHRFWSSKG